jgi:hypothetical protein
MFVSDDADSAAAGAAAEEELASLRHRVDELQAGPRQCTQGSPRNPPCI